MPARPTFAWHRRRASLAWHRWSMLVLAIGLALPSPASAATDEPTAAQIAEIRREMNDALQGFAQDVQAAAREHALIDRAVPVVIATSDSDLRAQQKLEQELFRNQDLIDMQAFMVQARRYMGKPPSTPDSVRGSVNYIRQAEATRPAPSNQPSGPAPSLKIKPGGVTVTLLIGPGNLPEADEEVILAENLRPHTDLKATLLIRGNEADQEEIDALREHLAPKFRAEMALLKMRIDRILRK
ncbi:MAG: hypothetical protein AAGK14_01775 [Verrucomicrobiota bacterium]